MVQFACQTFVTAALLALCQVQALAAASPAPLGPELMDESSRADVRQVVVVGSATPPADSVGGSYEDVTPGLLGGMSQGSRIGSPSAEIGGVQVTFPIPILTIPGAIFGGLSGATKRQIQEFRDALTEELSDADNKALNNYALSLDVFRNLSDLPDREARLFAPSTPIPEDYDAVLFVSFDQIGIDVEGSNAVITTTAKATLRRISDGTDIFETVARYHDTDSLRNWTRDDNALWRDYENYAAHFLGRAVVTALFGGVADGQVVVPESTASAKSSRRNPGRYVSKQRQPELGWLLEAAESPAPAAWVTTGTEVETTFDVEIYDAHRLVYAETGIRDNRHVVAVALEPCETYRWSVRPVYIAAGARRVGPWMRPGLRNGIVSELELRGDKASAAPAYIQDFPELEIRCSSR